MVRGGRRKRRTEAIWSPTCLPGTSAASPYLAPISGNSYNTHPLFRPRHCHDVPSGPRREPSPATLRGHAARLRACPHAALAAPKDVGRGASDGRQRGRGTEDESDAAGGSPSAGPHARKLKVGVPGWPLGAGAWAAWRAQPTASRPRPLGRVSDTIDAHSCAANRQGGRCHFLAIARPPFVASPPPNISDPHMEITAVAKARPPLSCQCHASPGHPDPCRASVLSPFNIAFDFLLFPRPSSPPDCRTSHFRSRENDV